MAKIGFTVEPDERVLAIFNELLKMDPEDKKLFEEGDAAINQIQDPGVRSKLRAVSNFARDTRFKDSMVLGMGNEYAYKHQQGQHAKTGREMHFVHMDLNKFKRLNSGLGQHEGDEAIKQAGAAILRAKQKVLGSKGMLFHVGGDEFRGMFESAEHSAQFMRAVRAELESLAPYKGYHHLSACFGHASGLGEEGAKAAEASLMSAKGRYKTADVPFPEHAVPAHAVSMGQDFDVHTPAVYRPGIAPPTPHQAVVEERRVYNDRRANDRRAGASLAAKDIVTKFEAKLTSTLSPIEKLE